MDHTILPTTRQRWFSCLYPSVLLVLIYRLRKDERLSWPEHREWTVGSELLCDNITGANCSIVMPHWAGVRERLAQGRYKLWFLINSFSNCGRIAYLVISWDTGRGNDDLDWNDLEMSFNIINYEKFDVKQSNGLEISPRSLAVYVSFESCIV